MGFSLLRFWTGPLPQEELFPTDRQPNPILHWILHPIKRHIARHYLKLLQRFCGLKVIAIAGSNGKTTTRTLLAHILPNNVATKDSITSTYNIPSSILQLRPWTKYFICEMSVEYVGDMRFYRWLTTPDIAIMTMIEIEHTKYFGSIESVAKEENYLLEHMPKNSIAIINGNSPKISTNTRAKVFKFGTSPEFDSYIKSVELTPDFHTKIQIIAKGTETTLTIPLVGKHFAHPIAATLLISDILDLNTEESVQNLLSITPPLHRANIVTNPSGLTIIDDTYNSNPSSAKASIETAIELTKLTQKNLIIIISQMNELGQYDIAEHQRLAEQIKKSDTKYVFSVGPSAKKIGKNFANTQELIDHLTNQKLPKNSLILIKGSRSWKLENLVDLLS